MSERLDGYSSPSRSAFVGHEPEPTPMSPAELLEKLLGLNYEAADENYDPLAIGLSLLATWRDAHGRAEREKAFALGFAASGEGYNGEYPTDQFERDPEWIKMRDAALQERPHDE